MNEDDERAAMLALVQEQEDEEEALKHEITEEAVKAREVAAAR